MSSFSLILINESSTVIGQAAVVSLPNKNVMYISILDRQSLINKNIQFKLRPHNRILVYL